jgi:uncharacterized protein YjiS (DUF1127 family)
MADVFQSNAREWVRNAHAFIAQLPDWILLTIQGWRERSRLRHDLDNLRQCGEFDRALTDSGIAFCDVPRLMRMHPLTPQLMDEMMQRQGIDRAALPPTHAGTNALREIEWGCGACAEWRKCHAWLASHDALESYRAFCPNAAAFDQLRRSKIMASGS